ncbi:ComF family protein [Rugamonas sp.]|uniref:ComF family protein n=1 Tax=Rugamonas sp. TaxID=1926287 RepID=UPI0025CBAC66|nr:ComF family protein [Rugamonas sp.]
MPASLRALLGAGRRALLHTLLPASCALCGGGSDEALCPACHAQFFSADVARCRLCANPLPAAGDAAAVADGAATGPRAAGMAGAPASEHGPLCGHCLAQRPAFDATLVAADYAVPLDRLVLQLKFGGRIALAALFARCLRDALLRRPGFVLPDLLCPVPLGPRRLSERGYNQALEIARPLARSLGVTLHPRLAQRVHDTTAQSRVTPDQRRQNIARAFAVSDGALVEGRHIGIVDDVMTSGQTLNELAATFKRYGAARVTNLVFARTPPHS